MGNSQNDTPSAASGDTVSPAGSGPAPHRAPGPPIRARSTPAYYKKGSKGIIFPLVHSLRPGPLHEGAVTASSWLGSFTSSLFTLHYSLFTIHSSLFLLPPPFLQKKSHFPLAFFRRLW